MTIKDIKALPVSELAAGDCALFLWITMPMLCEAWEVMEAWGFSYKTAAFVWIKLNQKADSVYWGMGQRGAVPAGDQGDPAPPSEEYPPSHPLPH